MRLGELRAGRGDPGDVRQYELERPPADEHRGRVDDVLAGRSVVHVAGRIAADGGAQRTDERLGGIADAPSLACDEVTVEELRATGRGDRPGCRWRDHPRGGLGLCEGALAVEHGLQPGAVAQLVEQCLRGEDRVEHRQTCSSPT